MTGLGLTSDWIIEKVAQVSLANHVAKLMQIQTNYFLTLNSKTSLWISLYYYILVS